MQKRARKTEMTLLAVPAEMLLEAGVFADSPIQMYVDGRRLVIENLDDTADFICDGDCTDCPFCDSDCADECESCPCRTHCEDSEVEEDA